MNSIVSTFIDYFDTVPPLLLLLVACFYTTKRRLRRDYVIWYIACQFVFNGYANLLNELEKDNLFVYSLNFSWSYYILSLYFSRLYGSQRLTALIFGLVVMYHVHALAPYQITATEATFNSIPFGIISLLITAGCIVYYARQLSEQPKENILTVSNFWYVNGIFTYYASNFFIFLTYETLVSRRYASIGVIWKIHNAVFLIMCLYFFVGMQCRNSPEK